MDPPSNLSVDYLDLLPDELLLKILIETNDLDTLSRWCQTSKLINNICQDKVLWKQKYQKNFGLSGEAVLIEGISWKERYKIMSLIGINSPISIGRYGYGIIDRKGNLYMTGMRQLLGVEHQVGMFSKGQHLIKFPLKDKNNSLSNLDDPFQKIISISVHSYSVGTVTSDGKVYVWGYNPSDMFGVGNEIYEIDSPRELSLPSRSGWGVHPAMDAEMSRKAIRIEISQYGYIILLDNFTAAIHMFIKPSNTYVRNIIDKKIIDISIKANMYAIITKNYELYIGGDIFDDKPNLSNELISLKFPKPIKRAILGDYFLIVLSITGEVYTQAYNDDPLEGTIFSKTKPELIKLPEPIVQISLGDDTYAALSETGKLYMWGFNNEDQISSDLIEYESRTAEILEPVEISFGLPINFVSVGPNATLAVSNDGMVNFWGNHGLKPE